MIEPKATTNSAAEHVLSARELEILALVACGHTNSRIAAELFLSPNTVRTHVRNILHKLGARTRAQAVAIALLTGVITIDEYTMTPNVRIAVGLTERVGLANGDNPPPVNGVAPR
jgi:DNA-binding CsgD family transcriptional regulator